VIPLDALRDDRRDRDGRREPTAREVFEIVRRYHAGEPYDDLMGGFTDWDYGRPDLGRRRPRRLTPPRFDPVVFTTTEQLEPQHAHDPEMVDRVRDRLVETARRHMDTHGYDSTDINWAMTQPSDPADVYVMRLTVAMVPRTDGQWPAIHAAIAEDEADRAEARAEARSSKATVERRLDALRASADVWRSTALRDASQAAGEAFTAFSEAIKRTPPRSFDR